MNEKGRKNEERNEIGEALRGLKRVEAPANFEFGVKAKIANGKPAEKSSISRFVRYAVPAALVLAVGAVLVLNNLYLAGERSVAGVPEVTEPKTAPTVNPAQELVNPEKTAPKQQLVASVDAPANPQRFAKSASNVVQRKVPNEMRGGSYDASQRLQEPIYPENANANSNIQASEINIKDVLGSLGIDASFDGTNWKVNSVREKSVADLAGIKAGDQPLAIDEHSLTDNKLFKKPFTARTITLIRDGKTVRLKLR